MPRILNLRRNCKDCLPCIHSKTLNKKNGNKILVHIANRERKKKYNEKERERRKRERERSYLSNRSLNILINGLDFLLKDKNS